MEREKTILRNSLSFINKYNLKPNYKIYSVIYCYFEGENLSLYDEVNKLVNNNKVDNKKLCKIYEKYFALEVNRDFNVKLSNIIREIKESISIIINKLNKRKDAIEEDINNNQVYNALNRLKFALSDITKFEQEILISKNKVTGLMDDISKLKEKVMIDFLTNCFNKFWLYKFISEHKGNYCIVFIDIDKFKQINDTYGHIIGDDVLRYLGNLFLTYCSKHEGYVIRWGGDEFIFIFENKSKGEVLTIMDDVMISMNKKQFRVKRTDDVFSISLSYGVELIEATSSNDFMKAIEKADKRMYRMKRGEER